LPKKDESSSPKRWLAQISWGTGEMDVFLKREKEEGAQGGVPAEKEME